MIRASTLPKELEALQLSAAELARRLSVPTNRITHILNGQRAITGDTALRLGHFFGTTHPAVTVTPISASVQPRNDKF